MTRWIETRNSIQRVRTSVADDDGYLYRCRLADSRLEEAIDGKTSSK